MIHVPAVQVKNTKNAAEPANKILTVVKNFLKNRKEFQCIEKILQIFP